MPLIQGISIVLLLQVGPSIPEFDNHLVWPRILASMSDRYNRYLLHSSQYAHCVFSLKCRGGRARSLNLRQTIVRPNYAEGRKTKISSTVCSPEFVARRRRDCFLCSKTKTAVTLYTSGGVDELLEPLLNHSQVRMSKSIDILKHILAAKLIIVFPDPQWALGGGSQNLFWLAVVQLYLH